MAKKVVWGWAQEDLSPHRVLPLEALAVYVGPNKLTTDTGGELGFWAHKQLAKSVFIKLGLLSAEQFHQIAWRQVCGTLYKVQQMFQIWACK